MPRYTLDALTLCRNRRVAVTVGVAVVLYSEAPFEPLAAAAANSLEAFLEFAPTGALDTHFAMSGWAKLTARALASQVSSLRNIPPGRVAYHLFLGQGSALGAIGSHAFRFDAARDADSGSIAFEFPLSIFDQLSVDALLERQTG